MITWSLTDHLCKACGGRVLKSETGAGMSPGGNPIYKCADCGVQKWGIMPDVICWCGMSHRDNNETPYKCVSFDKIKEMPELEDAFGACGCDPKRGEVGIVLERTLREIYKKYS